MRSCVRARSDSSHSHSDNFHVVHIFYTSYNNVYKVNNIVVCCCHVVNVEYILSCFFIKATKKACIYGNRAEKNLRPIFYLPSSFFVNVNTILALCLSDNISNNIFSILDLSIALFIGLEDCLFTYFSSFCWLLQITAAIHKFIADNLICYRSRQCPYTRR